MKTIAGYQVEKDGTLLNAPCACPGCMEEGRQDGHRYCANVPAPLIEAQERGEIVANLDNAGWHWQVRR